MAREIGNWSKPSPAAPSRAAVNDSRAVIAPLLQPGEQLIWHANGRGPHWTPHNILHAVFVPSVLIVFIYLMVSSTLAGKTPPGMVAYFAVIITGITIGLGWGIAHAVFSPSRDCYGLTDRRVIVVERFARRRERSFDAGNIKVLLIRDGATGDVTFWTQPRNYVNRAWAIVGIDNPRQIAELIKATLKLDLPVTDGVKSKEKLYIPPLEPRRPD
ncbi:MAG: hypothetical protein QM773_20025 [Hyphomonadaceae bacterium]